jgi:Asp-tRNA(Asn)/Glu-tRNA(Gln) amidotransferase A subunit family amidase
MIIKKEVSCVELIIIFGEIALSEGFKMNLITDCYIKEAYMKAKEKDKNLEEYLKRENRSIFYGLAISIKDNVIKKGSDSTLGCASYVNNE